MTEEHLMVLNIENIFGGKPEHGTDIRKQSRVRIMYKTLKHSLA